MRWLKWYDWPLIVAVIGAALLSQWLRRVAGW